VVKLFTTEIPTIVEIIEEILGKTVLSKEDLLFLLKSTGKDRLLLFEKAKETKTVYVGNKVYLRG